MASANLTSKGQITIPASVRAELGLETGTRVEFVKIAERKYAIMPATISVEIAEREVSVPRPPNND